MQSFTRSNMQTRIRLLFHDLPIGNVDGWNEEIRKTFREENSSTANIWPGTPQTQHKLLSLPAVSFHGAYFKN